MAPAIVWFREEPPPRRQPPSRRGPPRARRRRPGLRPRRPLPDGGLLPAPAAVPRRRASASWSRTWRRRARGSSSGRGPRARRSPRSPARRGPTPSTRTSITSRTAPRSRARRRRPSSAQGTKLRLLPDLHLVLPGSLRTGGRQALHRLHARSRAAGARRTRRSPFPRRRGSRRPPPSSIPAFRRSRCRGPPDFASRARRRTRRAASARGGGSGRPSASARSTGTPRPRDLPGVAGTSRLSPHLRFGTVGIRRLLAEARAGWKEADAEGRKSIDVFVGELAWREFYASILATFPRVLTESFRPEFERFPWIDGRARPRRASRPGATGGPATRSSTRGCGSSRTRGGCTTA